MENQESGKEFTKVDYDNYISKTRPYEIRLDNGGILSDQDRAYLESARMELWQGFSQTSLSRYHIVGHINGILSRDEVRKNHQEFLKLKEESDTLEVKLGEKRRAGILTPKEEDIVHTRLCEIGKEMYPYH
ncbi:MAG: hypothetical protein NT001_05445 [Candidatus Woesearchaeota archaeon]|nr:hypothetical protein [Candidatus Woesearchaeota archaeon]